MEHRGPFAGPGGLASRMGLLDLPDELLRQILRQLEDECVKEGETSAEFLQLRTVCKRLQRAVDSGIANLSRGIVRKFCRGERLRKVKRELQRQVARWSSLRRVELHVHGSNCALSQLIPALGQSCPGLTTLRIVKDLMPERLMICRSVAHFTSLTSLESLSLTGFYAFTATLPPLPSLRTLEADFNTLACPSPLPALEELVIDQTLDPSDYDTRALSMDMPHLHTSSRLRYLSLTWLCLQQLELPKSLRTLKLDNVRLAVPLDLGKDLPELAELLVVRGYSAPFPVKLEGLSVLLSHGHLSRIKLQGSKSGSASRFNVPEALALQTGLTSLCLHAVLVRDVQSVLATLTSLTELELNYLISLVAIDISCLTLHHLKLVELPRLHSIEGLGLQTGLTSLALESLPGITHLPELSTLRGLSMLELATLRLGNWTPECCAILPSLNFLRVAEVGQLTFQPTSPAAPSRRYLPPVATFLLELGTLNTLTELDLNLFAGSAIDLTSLPLLETLRLSDCPKLSDLSGIRSLPRLRSLELLDPMPDLDTLNIASCPRLTAATFHIKYLSHLTMEDLPRLQHLNYLSLNLCTVHVAACGLLKSLCLTGLHSLASLELTGLPQLHLPRLELTHAAGLKSVKLDGLTMLSCLILVECHDLEMVHVSGSPLIELVLSDLPKLTAPKLHINDLDLHGAGSALFPLAPPLPPHTATHQPPPGLPPVLPPSGSSPLNLQGLRRLTLILLPGQLSLDRIALQTRLRELMLDCLQVSHLPRELASLSALSKLVLMDLRVEPSDPLPPDSLSRLVELTIRGGTELLRWTGLRTGLSWDGSRVQVGGCNTGRDVGPFRSITKLELSQLTVESLDVSQLAFTRELTVSGCLSLTCLAGITDLPSLTSVCLVGIPKLQKLAILRCPEFVSIDCPNLEPLHLHMEDLPSLSLDAFCFHDRPLMCCPRGLAGCFPGDCMKSLKSLKLAGLPNVSRLLVSRHQALATVDVTHCRSLSEVNLDTLNSLTSLRLDRLAGGPSGEASSSSSRPPQLSKCIQHLFLVGMPMLKSLWWSSTPQNLVLRSCPTLTSLPLDQFATLENLELQDVAEEVLPGWLKQARCLKKMEFGRSSSNS